MKKVTVYSTPTCPYCVMVKEFFKEKNIEYIDVDVLADPQKAQDLIQKTGQVGVPVIIIENTEEKDEKKKEQIIIGFDQARLEEILGLK